jgi:hypothetical protein
MSEAPGQRSRENMTLAEGEVVSAGQVLEASGGNVVAYAGGTAMGVSLNNVDATDAPVLIAVIARDAEVNGYELLYTAGSPEVDVTAADDDLADVGIIVRRREGE